MRIYNTINSYKLVMNLNTYTKTNIFLLYPDKIEEVIFLLIIMEILYGIYDFIKHIFHTNKNIEPDLGLYSNNGITELGSKIIKNIFMDSVNLNKNIIDKIIIIHLENNTIFQNNDELHKKWKFINRPNYNKNITKIINSIKLNTNEIIILDTFQLNLKNMFFELKLEVEIVNNNVINNSISFGTSDIKIE